MRRVPVVLPSALIRTLLCSAALVAASTSVAAPEVEGIDLVSSRRFDRTKFDFTYSLRVRADAVSYATGGFTVTSSSPATTVLQPTISLGGLDAGSLIRSTGTFTIRHDRTTLFDPSALKFVFAGSPVPVAAGGAQVGTVQWLEISGRPGHEGLLPIQQSSPLAGSTPRLLVAIAGPVASARYVLSSPSGALLSTGSLVRTPHIVPAYDASLVVPSQTFRMTIEAVATGGQITSWTSNQLYSPQAPKIVIKPETALLKKGQTIAATIEIHSAANSGWRKVWLILPTGFASAAGPWDVLLTPGTVSTINTSITAPSTGRPYIPYTLGAAVGTSLSLDSAAVANQQLLVE